MAEKRIAASPLEAQKLSVRLAAMNLANERAQDVFDMFCEGKGVSGASFVSIEGSEVVVMVPDISPAKEGAA